MKMALFGISDIPLGKRNLKDPRLDQADKLAEAQKKTYAQVDLVDAEAIQDAHAILASSDSRADLILHDLEFVETRLGREPVAAEKAVLEKIRSALEGEHFVSQVPLNVEELQAISAHGFHTHKPVVVASAEELANPDALMLRAFKDCGYICFLTLGGKENRAWPIRVGTTAWEAAGAIHTDIQKGFIRAEIISIDDFMANAGETGAKRAGKQRLETKNYVVQDYDVTHFRFNK